VTMPMVNLANLERKTLFVNEKKPYVTASCPISLGSHLDNFNTSESLKDLFARITPTSGVSALSPSHLQSDSRCGRKAAHVLRGP
jgi:hypothetical protein